MIQRRFVGPAALMAVALAAALAGLPAVPAWADGPGAVGPPDSADPLPLSAEPEPVPASSEPLPAMTGGSGPGPLTAPAAILMDMLSGEVLFEHNADEPRPPASITKIMTMLLTYEAVAAGRASWDDEVVVSERAQSMGGTQAFLAAGQTFPLRDLLKAVAVASANDAAVAIAEHLEGSVEAFAEAMNRRAGELGMRTAHFANPHGLDEPGHQLSARDVAIASRQLLMNFPEVLELTTVWTYTFEVSNSCCLLTNTNRMIRRYQGVDGLKTGWTSRAGYGVSATAAQGDTRLIAVVMGHEHPEQRFAEAAQLLGWGFANFESVHLADAGDTFRRVPVYEGSAREVALIAPETYAIVVPRGEAEKLVHEVTVDLPLVAPVAEGAPLGTLRVLSGDREVANLPLVADRAIQRLSLPGMAWRLLLGTFPWKPAGP
ncbi:MAG TPA: D-alanyl-D-alanine carboxypeptidase family protein [Bacillota bacterium]